MIFSVYLILLISLYTVNSNVHPETLEIDIHSAQIVAHMIDGRCVFKGCAKDNVEALVRIEVIYDNNPHFIRRGSTELSLGSQRTINKKSVKLTRNFGSKPMHISIFLDGAQSTYKQTFDITVFGRPVPMIITPNITVFPVKLWLVVNSICPGFGGKNCNTKCLPSTMTECDEYTGLQLCTNGRFSSYCGSKSSACDDTPCKQRGVCIDQSVSVICLCDNRYAGQLCDDFRCHLDSCFHGTCINNVCYCKRNYEGTKCKNVKLLAPFCNGRGKIQRTHGDNFFICICNADAAGRRCEYTCKDPCKNGGVCNLFGATARCLCRPNFFGVSCEIAQRPGKCPTNYCLHQGKCEGLVDATFVCKCNELWTGSRCEESSCNSRSCYHGLCMAGSGCLCSLGYTGAKCDIPTTLNCEQCGEDGQCYVSGSSVRCACNSRTTTGQYCQYKCKNPCVNGVCSIKNSFLFCKCNVGFQGETCNEVSTSRQCSTNPCQNGGTCIPVGSDDFVCSCIRFYTGRHCEVSKCLSTACAYGVCLSGYGCICHSGYTGPTCSESMCPVGDKMCGAHGKCVVSGTRKFCLCEESIATGQFCEILCPVPCSIKGKCGIIDGEPGCVCDVGFSGLTCGPSNPDELYGVLYKVIIVLAAIALLAGIILFVRVSIYREHTIVLRLKNVMGIRPKTASDYYAYGSKTEGGTYGNFASVVQKTGME